MEKTIYFGLAIHSHQPVGNFPFVFAEAYRKAYLPFLELLERHPKIKISLHYSGPLRDWLAMEYPGFISRLRELVAQGQVEMLTSGYYEPILVSIPEEDRQGQISKLSQCIVNDFGYQPPGCWLSERVWEPSLAKTLAKAGVEYTVVDDHHFRGAGVEGEVLGYYVTEDEGYPLKIFASSQHLRYALPWHDVDEVIGWLKDQVSTQPRIAVMGDDGEKFGLWPGTYRLVWQEGWLERFFQRLEEEFPLIQSVTLGEYVRLQPPAGRIYLPTTSYIEMTEWALPADLASRLEELHHQPREEGKKAILPFLQGGHWRNFLAKYPEANDLHKKMLFVHHKVYSLPPSPTKERALDELWQGQSNDPYWHGTFGGIYLPHLRNATYQHLLAAETLADSILHPKGQWLEWEERDFRHDGRKQILVSGSRQDLYFAPSEGGTLFIWDWRERGLNLLSTLSRRPEGYHEKIRSQLTATPTLKEGKKAKTIHELVRVKEAGLETLLQYDPYRRLAFLDHFLSSDTTLANFQQGTYQEQGDFIAQPYEAIVEPYGEGIKVTLWREGQVRGEKGGSVLRVEKSFLVQKGSLALPVEYTLHNRGKNFLAMRFAVEVNLGLISGHAPNAFYHIPGVKLDDAHLDSQGKVKKISRLQIDNGWLGIKIDCQPQPPSRFWRFPIQTVSSSEAGFEKVYQASCLLFIWEVDTSPGANWKSRLLFQLRNRLPGKV